MNLLKLSEIASDIGITPATLRYHLREMGGFQRLGQAFVVTPKDLPRIKRYIAEARKSKGFQPGNKLAAKESL